jgi:ribosomal protein L18E
LSRIVKNSYPKITFIPAEEKKTEQKQSGTWKELLMLSPNSSKDLRSKKVSDKPDRFTSRIVAVVGTVTNDNRLTSTVPQGLKICALRFTNAARARIA